MSESTDIKTRKKPYQVEYHGCWWMPVAPWGRATIGSTEKLDAECMAMNLNTAFEAGRQYGQKEQSKEKKSSFVRK